MTPRHLASLILLSGAAIACEAVRGPPPKPPPEADDPVSAHPGEADEAVVAVPKLDDIKSRLDVIDAVAADSPAKSVVTYATLRSELIKRYLTIQGFDPNAAGDTSKAPLYKERHEPMHDDKLRTFEGSPLKSAFQNATATSTELEAFVTYAKLQLARTLYARAKLYFMMGRDSEAARELAPSLFDSPVGDLTAPMLECTRESAPSCGATVAMFEEKFPKLCPKVGSVHTCRRLAEEDLATIKSEPSKLVFVDTILSSATKNADGSWTLLGTDFTPDTVKDCATPGVKATDPHGAWIQTEREAWCNQVRGSKLKGLKVSYAVSAERLTLEPHQGDSARFLVEPKKVTSARSKDNKDVTNVTVQDAVITEVAIPDGVRFRWGSPFDWQFQGFKLLK